MAQGDVEATVELEDIETPTAEDDVEAITASALETCDFSVFFSNHKSQTSSKLGWCHKLWQFRFTV